jgi:hypothetical protein
MAQDELVSSAICRWQHGLRLDPSFELLGALSIERASSLADERVSGGRD